MASLVFAAAAIAAAGDLDPTFSADGKQISNFGAGPSAAAAAVRQADGKIVAVGAADGNFLVARYNLDGSLDPSFSGDGRLQTSFTGSDGAADVALQGNKIVVVGRSTNNANGFGYFALARYNPNGSLDPSFSGDGKQTTLWGGFGEGEATGVALQSDGKIVAVGITNIHGSHTRDFALARYNLNGSLDTSFSGDGLQTTDFLFGDGDQANDVAIQASGRIVAVGVAGGGATGNDFGLARYNANGTLDTSFSADGRKRTNFGCCDSANGVALQGDGRIVAVGTGNGEFALARYLGG
jgi:uncharacterized delta-60 repeat protein